MVLLYVSGELEYEYYISIYSRSPNHYFIIRNNGTGVKALVANLQNGMKVLPRSEIKN